MLKNIQTYNPEERFSFIIFEIEKATVVISFALYTNPRMIDET